MGASLTSCCDNSSNVATRPAASKELVVWGDYINSDTRTILAILEICNEKHTFKSLDTLRNKHLQDKEFATLNPTFDIPLMNELNFSVISGPMQFVNYLIQTRKKVRETLYPSESKAEIDRNIQHFAGKVRPVTGKIIRMLTTRLSEDFKDKNQDEISKEVLDKLSLSTSSRTASVPERTIIEREITTHLSKLLEHLNEHLGAKEYFGDG